MSIDKSLYKKVDRYDIEKLADGVYKINEYNLTSMFLIVGNDRALAIDCGTGVGDYKAVIESLTSLPYDLAITHAHVDHIGGRGQFGKMFISKDDECLIKSVTVKRRKSFVATMKYLMFFKVIRHRDANYIPILNEPELSYLKEGDTFDLGGKTVKVFETPAHTRGSLSYLAVEDRILFSGDVVNPNNLMFMPNATSIEEVRDTLKKIKNIGGYDTHWASHLNSPISLETLENGLACAEKAARKKNTALPLIAFARVKDFVIIHLTNKRKKN